MKYAIILPYYRRAPQMRAALAGMLKLYKGRTDFAITVVEAPQNTSDPAEHMAMVKVIDEYLGLELNVGWLSQNVNPDTICPGTAYNIGATQTDGEYIVLSNPECLHKSDILAGLDEEFARDPNCYVVCACMGMTESGHPHHWYQHSRHHDHKLNHCTAISRANYERLNGFDEAFADGYARTDIDFVWRVMNAGIPIVERDDLMTQHLYHAREYSVTPEEFALRHARSVLRLRAKWENMPINYNQEWVKRVQEVCW